MTIVRDFRSYIIKYLNLKIILGTPSKDELKVAELILLHLQILQFNAHEVYESKCSPNHRFKGVKAGYIGVAVYPTSSFFNHSCYPGVTR